MSAGANHSVRPKLQRAVAAPRHLLIRTFKNLRNNFLFFAVYFWCTIVMWRALTGAGYVEGQDPSNAQRSSLISSFESTFFLDTQRRAREAAGRSFEALRYGKRFSRSGKFDSDEVATDDVIGRLIFGDPRSTATAKD